MNLRKKSVNYLSSTTLKCETYGTDVQQILPSLPDCVESVSWRGVETNNDLRKDHTF